MKKGVIYLWGMAVLMTAAASCTKGDFPAGIQTKTMTVHQGTANPTGTRATIDNARNMMWETGDKVRYYCTETDGGAVSGKSGVVAITDVNSPVEIKFDYDRDNDKYIVVYSYGGSVTSATQTSGSLLTFTGGIPNSQVGGKLSSCHIAVGNESMEKNSVTLTNVQSYLAFSLNSNEMCGGKHINKIEIESRNGYALAGNVQVNPKSGEVSLTGTTYNKITLTLPGNANFEVNTTYYVAVNPRTYTGGFKLTYYETGTVLGFTEAKQNITINSGKIYNLSELRAHGEVMGKTMTLYPTKATILPGMAKRLWVKFTPEDVTKVTWTVSEEKKQDGSAATPMSIIKYPIKSNTALEYYDGAWCITADLETGGTKGSCKITATLEGNAKSASCVVHVDDYVDLGLSTGRLWCGYNIQGSGTSGLKLCSNIYDFGNYYQWGYLDAASADGTWRYPNTYMGRWTGGTWSVNNLDSGQWWYPTGGKYYSGDGKKVLDTGDDAAYYATGTKGYMPRKDDLDKLVSETTSKEAIRGGHLGLEYRGTALGYTDVFIYIPYSGGIDHHGDLKGQNICMNLRSATLVTDGGWETYISNNGGPWCGSYNATYGWYDNWAPVMINTSGGYGQPHYYLCDYAEDYRVRSTTIYNCASRIAAFAIRPVRNAW